METKDVITIFEGNVYSVGTNSSAITIPSKVKTNYKINDGDILMVGILRINHTQLSEPLTEGKKTGEDKPRIKNMPQRIGKSSDTDADAPVSILKRRFNVN